MNSSGFRRIDASFAFFLFLVFFPMLGYSWTEPKLLSEEEIINPEDYTREKGEAPGQKQKDKTLGTTDELVTVPESSKPKNEMTPKSPPSADSKNAILETSQPDTDESVKIEWKAPDYTNQHGSLGWTPTAFSVPEGLEKRVEFWEKIYTDFTTDQGIIHDSLYVGVIYEKIDFQHIMQDTRLSNWQKQRARIRLVKGRKKSIKRSLQALAKIDRASPGENIESKLKGEELHIWKLFKGIEDPKKFSKAASRKRVRFQLGQRNRFIKGIFYSGKYLKDMEKIFKEQGLPLELTRLPFVESSFNTRARSKVGASGVWQFMRYTGRRFMRINHVVDERNDPLRAAEAAAKLFRGNFELLKNWPLAVTGYNHGPHGVQRVVKRYKTSNIVNLVDARHGRFGFASANFYASFLAALNVEQSATEHFGKVYWDKEFDGKKLKIDKRINRSLLVKWFKGSQKQAMSYNLHIQRSFWRGYATLSSRDFVWVPKSEFELASKELRELPKNQGPEKKGLDYYVIGRGDTLSDIALQIGVNVRTIMEINNIHNPRRIRAGQKILIPIAN